MTEVGMLNWKSGVQLSPMAIFLSFSAVSDVCIYNPNYMKWITVFSQFSFPSKASPPFIKVRKL